MGVKMCRMPEMSGGVVCAQWSLNCADLTQTPTNGVIMMTVYCGFLCEFRLLGAAGSGGQVRRKENTPGWISVFPFGRAQSILSKGSMMELWVSPCKTESPFFFTKRTAMSFSKENFQGLNGAAWVILKVLIYQIRPMQNAPRDTVPLWLSFIRGCLQGVIVR